MTSFSNLKKQLIEQIIDANSLTELQLIIDQYKAQNNYSVEDLVGRYELKGVNQDENESSYSGTLDLSVNEIGRVKALWLIGKDQLQFGSGFYENNILVINFYYEGDDIYRGQQFKGVVVYKVLSDGNLQGFWSEKHGDQRFLGKEYAVKVQNIKTDFSLN